MPCGTPWSLERLRKVIMAQTNILVLNTLSAQTYPDTAKFFHFFERVSPRFHFYVIINQAWRILQNITKLLCVCLCVKA